jgi:hypothetical protein
MSFCTGCSNFMYQAIQNTKMPDGSYVRGPGYVCTSLDAIRASQKEENYDSSILVQAIGKVCWSCRGEFYTWDGETEKPVQITRLEKFKTQLVEEKVPLPETTKVLQAKEKKRGISSKKKRLEDPSKKRKSKNSGLC